MIAGKSEHEIIKYDIVEDPFVSSDCVECYVQCYVPRSEILQQVAVPMYVYFTTALSGDLLLLLPLLLPLLLSTQQPVLAREQALSCPAQNRGAAAAAAAWSRHAGRGGAAILE